MAAQRLLRRICTNCKEPVTYPKEYLDAARINAHDQEIVFYKGKGCDRCGGTGYKGRAGLYEVMAMSSELRRLIMQGASADELREQGLTEGMLTLRMDGMRKVAQGVTTLEEVVKETAAS